MDEQTYHVLAQRYKELSKLIDTPSANEELPFDIDGYLTEIDSVIV